MCTQAQVRAVGLTRDAQRWRLRTGRLFEVHPRVLALTPMLSEDGSRAAALLATSGTLSHESALHLFGLVHRPAVLHVTVVGDRRRLRGVRCHRTRGWATADLTRVRGLSATTVGRALLDVARDTSPPELRQLVHEAQYRKLIDPLSLDAILAEHRGHPGLAKLAAIEPADGRDAHARMLAFENDRARDADIAATRWLPLRYTSGQLRSPATVIAQVAGALSR